MFFQCCRREPVALISYRLYVIQKTDLQLSAGSIIDRLHARRERAGGGDEALCRSTDGANDAGGENRPAQSACIGRHRHRRVASEQRGRRHPPRKSGRFVQCERRFRNPRDTAYCRGREPVRYSSAIWHGCDSRL